MAQFSWSVWLCLYLLVSGFPAVAQERLPTASPGETVAQMVRDVFSVQTATRRRALTALQKLDNPGAIPGLIQALRFIRDEEAISAALNALAKTRIGTNWNEWMLWQQAHPEIVPFAGFDAFKIDVMALIDPDFRLFLKPGIEHEIRLEEVAWGGVRKDGIPALVNPIHINPSEATYLEDDELVFGVSIKGDARAYPLRILDWHEMFNDVIGGVPVALAYCTLCGSGILYETHVPSRSAPLVFGSSGFLYRSNKLMYDRQTNSLWNQFSGRPIVGPLTGSGIVLNVRPVAISNWKDWLKRHPETKVLSLDTGHLRDYTPGRPYGEYFNSPELMFPALTPDSRLAPKDYVFALRVDGYEKAWPLSAFTNMPVINDRVGDIELVLIGNTATRTVRAYRTDGRNFAAAETFTLGLIANKETWMVNEDAMVSESGERLVRLPGHIAYWFAWRQNNPTAPLYGH